MPPNSDVLLQPLNRNAGDFVDAESESDSESAVLVRSPQETFRDVERGRPKREDLTSSLKQENTSRLLKWLRGPHPPRAFSVTPFFAGFQTWPIRILDKVKYKGVVFFVLCASWLVLYLLILYRSNNYCSIGEFGQPVRLSCISRFWKDAPSCGLDGSECEPFANITFAFRCPANCEGSKVWTPYVIGTEEIVYRNLVIGGSISTENMSTIYRGDSFICASARHAGLISNTYGGGGIASLVGEQSNFPAQYANGIDSVGFLPSFPHSFTFLPTSSDLPSACKDPRWLILSVSVVFTTLLSVLTTSPALFFWSSFIISFFTVAFGVDPPDSDDFNEVVSTGFARFLPAAFVAAIIYRYCARRTLDGLTAQYEKTILWLGACWIGSLNAYTFDTIPIQRLTPHDLKSQPGAIPTLIFLVALIIAITLGQAWAFRIEGRLPRYLSFYGILAAILLSFVAIPNLNLRIHHYILGLLFLPGTAIQTRPSLLYQGLLVGLFISGVARWGFASILETDALLFVDGPVGGAKPTIPTPAINGAIISLDWSNLTNITDPTASDRMSIVINDVERFRSQFGGLPVTSFNWTRQHPDEPEYIRMAYVRTSRVGQDLVGDYTKPGTWLTNGTWTPPKID